MAHALQNKHALLLALGGIAVFAAYLWVNWEPAIPVPASARAPNVTGVQSVPGGPQTPEYSRLQQMADQARANRARETGGSAVPTPPQLDALPAGEKPATAPPGARSATTAPTTAPPASTPPPDETDRLTNNFARAMQTQTKQLVEFRKRFEPAPTQMKTFEDVKGQREQAEARQRAERLLSATREQRPRDRRGLLQPGDILHAVLQTAINSDEPGPVRAKVVGERFKGAILLGGLTSFPPVAGSRPERVLVKFNYLTLPSRITYSIEAFAIDSETARTALATDVDHHYLERWGSLFLAKGLEGYGNAVRARNSITTIGPLGNIISVPKDNIDHEEIVWEAAGTVGEGMGDAVGENFRRPNTITVEPGTGIGVLIVAPASKDQDDEQIEEQTTGGPPRTVRTRATQATARTQEERRLTPTGLPTLTAPSFPEAVE